MPTLITSQVVRVTFTRVSLTDPTIYYYEWDALTTHPAIVDEFERSIKADTSNFQNVSRSVRTNLP